VQAWGGIATGPLCWLQVRAVAQLAAQANQALENIGARRLHTILERVLAEVAFDAPELVARARAAGEERYRYVVDAAQVHRCLDGLLQKQDMSRYMI
jgi:ATP-dependent HslUV protease ATP-binding subunit HslU